MYAELVEKRIDQLRILRKRGQTIAEGIIGHSLMKEDLFFCAADDRALKLIDGFICMLRDRNLTCAGALLRLQMDNCMRTYAAFTAQDRNAVIDCIIDGTPINRQFSKDGNDFIPNHS